MIMRSWHLGAILAVFLLTLAACGPAVEPEHPTISVTIDSPKGGDVVGCRISIKGTLSAPLSADQSLWVVIHPIDAEKPTGYHPQKNGILTDREWSAQSQIGLCPAEDPDGKDLNRSFEIYVGVANEEVAKEFEDYLAQGGNMTPPWPGLADLPDKFNHLKQISVTRK